ncbi:MAG: tRNA (adenosine(37)-N6)-threonylcarbamoyltransferase complex dimerization subunit type 1 TsaB [Patescibacteria group bacterium]|jgi:tRNA threonylcarbamoyladenosine biosynthesis protein TsaB
MTLLIDTTQKDLIVIGLKDKDKLIAVKKFKSHRTQAEKLLPAIGRLLKANKLKLSDLKKIEVENRGGSFTSLRIGVVTANALAYALGIPISGGKQPEKRSKKLAAAEPIYDREPEITKKKSRSS